MLLTVLLYSPLHYTALYWLQCDSQASGASLSDDQNLTNLNLARLNKAGRSWDWTLERLVGKVLDHNALKLFKHSACWGAHMSLGIDSPINRLGSHLNWCCRKHIRGQWQWRRFLCCGSLGSSSTKCHGTFFTFSKTIGFTSNRTQTNLTSCSCCGCPGKIPLCIMIGLLLTDLTRISLPIDHLCIVGTPSFTELYT